MNERIGERFSTLLVARKTNNGRFDFKLEFRDFTTSALLVDKEKNNFLNFFLYEIQFFYGNSSKWTRVMQSKRKSIK